MDLLMRNALTLKCISKKFPAFVYSTHLVVCLQQRLPGRLLKPHVSAIHRLFLSQRSYLFEVKIPALVYSNFNCSCSTLVSRRYNTI